MVISGGIVQKPTKGLKINFLEKEHTCKKQKSNHKGLEESAASTSTDNSEKKHLSKRKRHPTFKQKHDTGSSSESGDERPLKVVHNEPEKLKELKGVATEPMAIPLTDPEESTGEQISPNPCNESIAEKLEKSSSEDE